MTTPTHTLFVQARCQIYHAGRVPGLVLCKYARSVVLGVKIDTVQQYYGVSERCDGERSVVQ